MRRAAESAVDTNLTRWLACQLAVSVRRPGSLTSRVATALYAIACMPINPRLFASRQSSQGQAPCHQERICQPADHHKDHSERASLSRCNMETPMD